MMRYRAIEAGSFGNMQISANGPLRKSERKGPTANLPLPALYTAP
jgi:hypothetical protein